MSANASPTADSYELENLFDSIAFAANIAAPLPSALTPVPIRTPPPLAQVPPLMPSLAGVVDAPKAEVQDTSRTGEAAESRPANSNVINSVGLLTRKLHDTLAELGYDRQLQEVAADALPDARQRLAYVVTLTEQAASRCLNAVDAATPLQEELAADAALLAAGWDSVFASKVDVAEFRKIAEATRDYLHSVPKRTVATREQLREIVLAQEFQDLTGQVLKRITELANHLETQLLTLLVENSPVPIKRTEALGLLQGPQVGATTGDVVANQAQVDELLESLGF